MNVSIQTFKDALLEINREYAREIFREIYEENGDFGLLENLVISTLDEIGLGFESGEISLSQVYMSGSICEKLMEEYMPESKKALTSQPQIAIAVLKDHHALGKRIVYSVLRASGYSLIDFGHGLSAKDIANRAIKEKIDILLVSTLMLHSALEVEKIVEILKKEGASTKVIVGGAPFRLDPNLYKRVRADADGKNGVGALKIIREFVKGGDLL